MASVTYKKIVSKANSIKKNVEKNYKLGENGVWAYYIAKAILSPAKDITIISVNSAPKQSGDYVSRQANKSQYVDMAKRLVKYVEKNNQLPNYITLENKKIKVNDYVYMFARVLVYYNSHGQYPYYANINSKAFTKPSESQNAVYSYFVKVFGSFGDTIDGALKKIQSKGYGYYYDDVYSNSQSIDRIKAGKGVNCTDSCQVFYNIVLELIKKGKYKKVECLHIKCQGGDGHVRLRITDKNGNYFYRDPAAVLDGEGITSNWCSNGSLLAVNPSWFMQNLNR